LSLREGVRELAASQGVRECGVGSESVRESEGVRLREPESQGVCESQLPTRERASQPTREPERASECHR